jgi:hypothetical protein
MKGYKAMEMILKKAMIHYLNKKIAILDKHIDEIENTSKFPEELRIGISNTAVSKMDTLRAILNDVKTDKIDKIYDNFCIENGLDRTGNHFSTM